MITSILIGLLGLGMVVTIHEYGHLLAARLVGVGVQVFSIGWGKKIFGIMRGGTEYRISLFPIGGYVRMRGEEALMRAYNRKQQKIDHIPGGFFTASAWKRIIIAAGGPLFNIIAALIIFGIISTIGYTINTYENKIVLVSDTDQQKYAADAAGLQSGDRIISIDDRPISYFFQIREQISEAPADGVDIVIVRNGRQMSLRVYPELDRQIGVRLLGIYPWIDPVIGSIAPNSSGDIAGLTVDDVIISVDGRAVEHGAQFNQLFDRGVGSTISIMVRREGSAQEFRLAIGEDEEGNPDTGIGFAAVSTRIQAVGILQAGAGAVQEVVRVFRLTIRGIASIFSGVEVGRVVAGPIQLTTIIGDVTKSGNENGFWSAMRTLFNFLAIINVALCFMNLLPIPVLDGGQILLFAYEALRGKALGPRIIVRYQQVGAICIAALLILAITSDFFFLFN